jgi:hypothetical protein
MVCLRTRFHMSSSSGSLIIVIQPKAKQAVLLFYILHKI